VTAANRFDGAYLLHHIRIFQRFAIHYIFPVMHRNIAGYFIFPALAGISALTQVLIVAPFGKAFF
jgi:hypothetical protein